MPANDAIEPISATETMPSGEPAFTPPADTVSASTGDTLAGGASLNDTAPVGPVDAKTGEPVEGQKEDEAKTPFVQPVIANEHPL